MKTQRQSKGQKRNGLKNKILILILIPILIAVYGSLNAIQSGESCKVSANSSSLDSLTFVYNSIDAFNFPKIVSLVTVMDMAGFIIPQLDENNFMVFEDNTRELPIEVVELTDADVGINVVLTIDRSSSMEGQPIMDAKTAASTFVDLMQSKDRSAIVAFAGTAETAHPFSSNKDSLKAAIAKMITIVRTAIYDALMHSVNLMTDDIKNRAIILMTDGEDNASFYSPDDVIAACKSKEIRVFTIGLGNRITSVVENVLIRIANETGGLYYYSPTSEDLEEIYRAISKLLHHRYQISYTTHNPAKDGTLRHVRIEVLVSSLAGADTANYRAPYEPDPEDPVDPDTVKPAEPKFEVLPNPFTPNDDGFNDWTEFKQGDEIHPDWNIVITDRAGQMIKQLRNGETIWNGRNKSGQLMLPGSYLYVVSKGNQAIHRGLIQLIR